MLLHCGRIFVSKRRKNMSRIEKLGVACGVFLFTSVAVSLFADLSQLPTTLSDSVLESVTGADGTTDAGDCTNKTLPSDPCVACAPYMEDLSKNCDALPNGATEQNCDVYTSSTDCVRCTCQILIACGGNAYSYSDNVCGAGKKKTGSCVRTYSNCTNANCKTQTKCP